VGIHNTFSKIVLRKAFIRTGDGLDRGIKKHLKKCSRCDRLSIVSMIKYMRVLFLSFESDQNKNVKEVRREYLGSRLLVCPWSVYKRDRR